MPGRGPTRSTRVSWRACMRPATCRRSGRRTRRRNGCAGWWRGATRSCATGPGSRTRCIRSCMPTRSRSARTPIASTGPGGRGGGPAAARGRARGDRPPRPRARPARRGPRGARPGHRRERHRRHEHRPAADHRRGEPDGGGRADGGDRRHRPRRRPATTFAGGARTPPPGKVSMGCPAALPADTPLFATRSPAQREDSTAQKEGLVEHIRRGDLRGMSCRRGRRSRSRPCGG